MQTEIDPVAASAMRMITAFAAHSLLRLTGARIALPTQTITLNIFWSRHSTALLPWRLV